MGQIIATLFPLRLRLWFGKLIYRPLGPSVYRVSPHRIIKGPCDPPEIEAMRYVASNTTIPLPKLHHVHTEKDGRIFIEMDFIPGETLDSAWSSLSTAQREVLFADLQRYLTCLRQLPPPAQDLVSSALQNPAFDCRVGDRFFGPVDHAGFHSLVRGHCAMDDVAQFLGGDVVSTHTSSYKTHFTHADLAPRNIIVRDGRIAAIIDWAFAGWYPEYWEFTKAQYTRFRGQEWAHFLSFALPGYEKELRAEQALWETLPEQGSQYTVYQDGVPIEHRGSSPSAAWVKARNIDEVDDMWSVTLSRQGYDKLDELEKQ